VDFDPAASFDSAYTRHSRIWNDYRVLHNSAFGGVSATLQQLQPVGFIEPPETSGACWGCFSESSAGLPHTSRKEDASCARLDTGLKWDVRTVIAPFDAKELLDLVCLSGLIE
jgi:hypothetical protein